MKTILLNAGKLFIGMSIIFLFLSVGRLITAYLEVAFPASIVAMLLLFLALNLGLIKLNWILLTGNLFLKYLALLFIPVGVGLIDYLDVIIARWPVIVASLFFTTFATLLIVGHFYQYLSKKEGVK